MGGLSSYTVSITTEDASSCLCSATEVCQLLQEKEAIIDGFLSELKKLEAENLFLRKETDKLSRKNRRLNTAINTYRHMLFGRSSEKSSGEEPQEISIPENIAAEGIITADRYRAYIELARTVPGLLLSFCWAPSGWIQKIH